MRPILLLRPEPTRESRTGLEKEAKMFDSFSEGSVYYGRTFLLVAGAIALAIIVALL